MTKQLNEISQTVDALRRSLPTGAKERAAHRTADAILAAAATAILRIRESETSPGGSPTARAKALFDEALGS